MAISRGHYVAGYRMLLGLALLLITWMALTPQPVELPEAPLADKWGHFVAFLGLAFLVDASWPTRGFDLPKWAPLLGYGLAIELIQSQIPNRTLSLGDFVADAAGVAVYALGVVWLLHRAGMR